MSTAFIICHYYCKKTGHNVRDYKSKLEKSKFEMQKSGKSNNERKATWRRYHHSNSGHSDEECFQHMEKSEKIKNERQKKWCSLHNNTRHSNEKCY